MEKTINKQAPVNDAKRYMDMYDATMMKIDALQKEADLYKAFALLQQLSGEEVATPAWLMAFEPEDKVRVFDEGAKVTSYSSTPNAVTTRVKRAIDRFKMYTEKKPLWAESALNCAKLIDDSRNQNG